jgi:hypothetical protein
MPIDDREVGRLLREAARRRRGHADFFSWPPDRDLEEAYVVGHLASSAAESGRPLFQKILARGRPNDPPDVEAIDKEGRRVAIEVTELVDPDAIRAAKNGKPYWPEWTAESFRSRIRELLQGKARRRPVLKGGPYPGGYVVVIYTDEPELRPDVIASLLTEPFEITAVDRAFILLSYEPRTSNYPYFEIPLL